MRLKLNLKLDKELKGMGFKPSIADPCIYIKTDGEDWCFMGVYVDDIVIAGASKAKIEKSSTQNLT